MAKLQAWEGSGSSDVGFDRGICGNKQIQTRERPASMKTVVLMRSGY